MKRAQVSTITISRLKRGETRHVSAEIVSRSAQSLETSTDYLLGLKREEQVDYMNVFELRNRLVANYGDFVRGFFHIQDKRIHDKVEAELRAGLLWPEPLIQLNPSFEPGAWIDELVSDGTLHEECGTIFRKDKDEAESGGQGKRLRLHRHQTEALQVARAGDDYVLTTGTGSGKSLVYIIPIVDHVLRNGSGRGIQAIVVYSMNALANSQEGELEKFLCRGYPNHQGPVTFALYTGQQSDERKQEIIANPPDILLTNYVMLELLLTRPDEKPLIQAGKGLRFLVLDELHTYRGRQGADVAMLVRRTREAFATEHLQCVGTSATLECGQEYYCVRVSRHAETHRRVFTSRELSDQLSDQNSEAGFLYISSTQPWPINAEQMMQRLPDDWLEEHRGVLQVRSNRSSSLPQPVRISPEGHEADAGHDCAYLPAPFRFCLRCGVSYGFRQTSDFAKLASLGTEGRSSATTILSLAVIRFLHHDQALHERSRKLLSFTDNRQDASLQAGHFNDFVEIGLLRSALYKAVVAAGSEGLRYDELVQRVFDALDLPIELYASDPHVRFQALEETKRALRSVLSYRLYRDLKRGWRITAPNLEQCGLLEITYLSLDEVCQAEDVWQGCHPALLTATPETRHNVAKTLLDYMRRELAIKVDVLDEITQERMQQQSSQRLISPWALDDSERMEHAAILYPRSMRRGQDYGGHVYLSPRGGFGQYLRCPATLPDYSERLTLDDTQVICQQLLEALKVAGLTEVVALPRDADDVPGYQLPASALCWVAGDGTHAFHDPIRVPRASETGGRTNPFFIDYYQAIAAEGKGLEAREHTAQVQYELRIRREDEFRDGRLPILYCSPTMELGVDISELNVVNLRNMPPTPANYAQRSGRAGRSSLGVSVPVPVETDTIIEAVFESLLMREQAGTAQPLLPGLDTYLQPKRDDLHRQWEDVANRERRSRTMFAQEPIAAMVDEVARELDEVRAAVGSADAVAAFTVEAFRSHKAVVTRNGKHVCVDLTEAPRALRDVLELPDNRQTFEAQFELPVEDGVLYLDRTHPIVEGLATYLLDTALDPIGDGIARRAGAIRTSAVTRRTTLLLVRFRYDIVTRRGTDELTQLAEESRLLAFEGPPGDAEWLDESTAEALLHAEPDANILHEQAITFVQRVIEGFASLQPHLDEAARRRADTLYEAHRRVRTAARMRGVNYQVKPQLPPDVLGIFVYLPGGQRVANRE